MSFTRKYRQGTSVSLIAPSTAGGGNFFRWRKDGGFYASTAATSLSINSATTTMDAEYISPITCANISMPDEIEPLVGGVGRFKKVLNTGTSAGAQGFISRESIVGQGTLQARFRQNFNSLAGLVYSPVSCAATGWGLLQQEHDIDFNPNFLYVHYINEPMDNLNGIGNPIAEQNSTSHVTSDVLKIVVGTDHKIRWYKNDLPKDGGMGNEESPLTYDGVSPLYFFVFLRFIDSEVWIDRFDQSII